MVQQLLEKEAPMKEIKINPEKLQTSRKKKKDWSHFQPKINKYEKELKGVLSPSYVSIYDEG